MAFARVGLGLMELAMLPQVPPVLVQKGVHKEKPPPLGLEKGREKQNIEICKPSTGWWLPGQPQFLFFGRIPGSPSTPLAPCVPGSAVRRKSQVKCFA